MISIRNNITRKMIFFILAFLACWAPRFQSALRIGSLFSVFSVFSILIYFMFVRKITLYKTIGGITFFVWLLLTLLSIWRTVNIGQWMNYLYWVAIAYINYQTIMWFMKKCENTDQKFEIISAVFHAFALAMSIHVLLGVVEIRTGIHLFDTNHKLVKTFRPISIFYNVNDYATFIATFFPIAVYQYCQSKKNRDRIYYLIFIALAIYVILLGNSRGATLAIALDLVLALFLYCRKSIRNTIIGILIVLMALGVVLFSSNLKSQIIYLASNQTVDLTSNNDIARYNLIRNGLYFIKETHGMGVGAGNLHYWLTQKNVYNAFGIGFMHNWFVEIAATYGVPFFVLYISFHITSIVVMLKNYKKGRQFWTINNTLLVSIVGFSMASVSSSSNMYSEWVWLYLVVISSYCSIVQEKAKNENILTSGSFDNKEKKTLKLIDLQGFERF